MLKKTENLWKIVGCFWTWQNGVFWVCFFEVLVLLWFVFGVFGIVPGVLKMLVCFSQFFGLLWGGLFLLILGLEGLGVFVFLVFVFFVLLLFLFCFCFVCFVFVLLLDWFWCWFLFCFCFCFFVCSFVFCSCIFYFLLFNGQVRWSKGPPHLALNPPYFFCFWFLLFFFVLLFLEGLRVRWGGPKGHLTWP